MLRSKLLHATALNSHWEMFHLLFELSLNVGHQLLFLSLLSLHVTQHCKWKIHKTGAICLQHFMYIAQLHTEGYSLQHFIYIAQLHTEGYCLQHFMYIARSHTVHAASTGSLFCTLTLSATNRAFTEHLSQEIEGGVWVRAWVCMW